MAADQPPSPLLSVKRSIPSVRPGAVRRERLESRIDAATRLVVVVAPAGWGKTSLVSRWATGTAGVRVAWVSLDEGDDDPVRFWSYVLTALHEVSADVTRQALEALPVSGEGPMSHALPVLLNELSESAGRHVLVLDDYHLIVRPEVHESLEFLIAHLPPSLRVVLVSRVDPPLPLARMRVRGELVEVRADDLRFSAEESAAMVTALAETELDPGTTTAVWERTEGWAAGLQLAGLALRGGSTRTVVTDDRHLFDYFADEVLPALAPAQRELLVRAAPLELLSGPLCDAALGITGSAKVLAELERADLFIVALDPERVWFRCHRLLRDTLLGVAADARDVTGVHARAAGWFEAHDRIDDAVRHFLAADDEESARRLLSAWLPWFLERGWSAAYLALGERLSADSLDPQLALSLAYAADRSSDRAGVTRWMDLAERRIDAATSLNHWRSARGGLMSLRAAMEVPASEPDEAVRLAERGAALEAEAGSTGHPDAEAARGLAYGLAGRFEEAVRLLQAGWDARVEHGWTRERGLSVANFLSLFLLALGADEEVDRLLAETREPADAAVRDWGEAAAAHVVALLRLAAGRRSYQRGDLAEARVDLSAGLALAEIPARPTFVVVALVFLADLELAEGDRAAARAALAAARELADNDPVTPFVAGWLADAETRIGRSAARAAARAGSLFEALTDRELSILRMLPGTASQREIGAALFLSINTVKAYNKSLYRKLDVGSRADAVRVARELGLI